MSFAARTKRLTAAQILAALLTVDGPGSGLNADLLDGQSSAYFAAATEVTAASILSKLLTVDGAGSGLDADLLDGQSSAYYLAASSYTAADVLAKLLTVDGSGSGLDADLLDGQSSAYFLDAGNMSAGTLAAARGGTGVSNTGTLTNASNTIITGGGTLALGGFTLTVPATGTAALRGTANTFTAKQTIDVAGVGLDIIGTQASLGNGPDIRLKFPSDPDAALSYFSFDHDNIALIFDAHLETSGLVASDTTAFLIYKSNDKIQFFGNSGLTKGAGYSLSPTPILTMDASGIVTVPGTTASTSTTTGTLVVTGGAGIGGSLSLSTLLNFYTSTTAKQINAYNGGDLELVTRTAGDAIRFYTGNGSLALTLGSTQTATFVSAVLSTGGTGGIGYGTGAGGTVTQITSKATGVTLNKVCGQITMNNAALAAGAKVSFVVTNSACAATDIPRVVVVSGGTANAYRASVTAVAAGSFTVTVENITGGSLSEAPVLGFDIGKAVTA